MCVRSGDPQKPLPAAITKGIRRFYCEASQSPIAGAAAARLAGFPQHLWNDGGRVFFDRAACYVAQGYEAQLRGRNQPAHVAG